MGLSVEQVPFDEAALHRRQLVEHGARFHDVRHALAIARGTPLYNNGQPAATIAIYEVAARGVLALQSGVPMAARTRLENGLREADRTREEDDRAWVLRRMLDDTARLIDGRRMMTSDR